MIFAPPYTPLERALVGRLRLLGYDDEGSTAPRRDFRESLRDRLLDEAASDRAA